MQTLRKRSSPCKYKNEPSRFLGEGMTFKAKLIGILEVNEARGDKMCQDALNDLKTAIRAAGEHKQRITISIAIDGLRLRDEKSGDCLYHHPVHKISFIAQDMSDSRAFGYIFGSPDTGHRFFGIKTDKTASQVVISMRDLFQVVFELKKKEIEMAKHHIEQRQIKYGAASNTDSIHALKDDFENDRGKGKYQQLTKMRNVSSKTGESSSTATKANTSEAIADLLDLEHELNSIQQGINQMDRITPSDPFGPLSKGDPFLDPFKDPFSSKVGNASEVKVSPPISCKTFSVKPVSGSHGRPIDSPTEPKGEQQNAFVSANSVSTKSNFFPQFSPNDTKPDVEEPHWFDQETESLFNDRTNVSNTEPNSSSVTFHGEKTDAGQQQEEKKSPMKLDVFMELDPLGTGWVKPYIDKKDFFQDLKNPPKKVLKELIIGNSTNETPHYFPSQLESNKSPQNNNSTSNKEQSTIKSTIASASSSVLNSLPSSKDVSGVNKYSKIDPFEDGDPFDKTDPFSESNFPTSLGLPSLYNEKQFDAVFPEAASYERTMKEPEFSPPSKFSMFSANAIHGPLRVSLPPEKSDTNTPITLSSITSKFRSSPSPPEETKSLRRRNYQMLKQSVEDKNEDESRLPVHDEFFCASRSPKKSSSYSPKTQRKTFKEKALPVQTLPSAKHEKVSTLWSDEFSDNVSNNSQNAKASALFSIKPPPVPPKKQNQSNFKPPPRPPSLDDNNGHYDHTKAQEEPDRFQEPRSPKMDNQKAKTGLRRPNSDDSSFPLLPPPPQRKTSVEKAPEGRMQREQRHKGIGGSILNITLNQLDNTGLQNLAATLGISSDHLYNMTLQELTKRLSEKCMKKTEINQNETFQADFESNFNNKEIGDDAPPYDKYAAFKELIENDNRNADYGAESHSTEEDQGRLDQKANDEQPNSRKSAKQEEEDRYAALRQLSLNPQKSENLSEDLDLSVEDDSSTKADNMSDNLKTKTEDSITSKNDMESLTDSSAIKTAKDWSGEALVAKEERGEDEEADQISTESTKTPSTEFANIKETQKTDFNGENNLLKDEDKETKEKPEEARDNWATFDKVSVFEENNLIKGSTEAFNDAENENSPFSSDGKEDSFNWHKKKSKQRGRGDKTWRDEDESWDDYSAKESYWSDESSHDDRSPDKRREGRYVRRGWNKQTRKSKATTNEQWFRRAKWNEDTEDEYEESWKNHRRRIGTCDIDRKDEMCPFNSYENYEQSYKWCNSRSEPWEENDRYLRCFTERRKRSESDDEYRRRCDSDTSDREYVWTIKRNFPESYGRSEKQKQYRMLPYMSRDYAERCHESRSKHKKGESHKRPSSVSEGKRNYDKMYASDHMNKSNRRMQDDDVSPSYHKDFRYCCGSESAHYYNSYDRRLQMVHVKKPNRNRRNEEQIQYVTGLEGKELKPESFEYYKSSWHKARDDIRRNGHFQFEDDFTPETPEKPLVNPKLQSPKRDPSKSPRKKQREEWTSCDKEGFLQTDNSSENFAKFGDEFKTTEISKSNDENDREQTVKQQMMGQNHFAVLSRQESSASLRKSESINIFSRENDPFEGDDFFSSAPSSSHKLNRFTSEKSKSNSNVSDAFAWKEVFGDSSYHE